MIKLPRKLYVFVCIASLMIGTALVVLDAVRFGTEATSAFFAMMIATIGWLAKAAPDDEI